MNTKKFFLTALAVVALFTASLSNVFSSEDGNTLKCYDDMSFKVSDDSTDGSGGPKIPPTGN
jgi:hypothetical protein